VAPSPPPGCTPSALHSSAAICTPSHAKKLFRMANSWIANERQREKREKEREEKRREERREREREREF